MSNNPVRVLLVEDSADNARLVGALLGRATGRRFDIHWCDSLGAAIRYGSDAPVDVTLLDLNLPDSGGVETVQRFHEAHPALPIVIVSSINDDDVFFKAMRQGAQDYLLKGELSVELLVRAVLYAIGRKQDEIELDCSRTALRELALHLQDIREEERSRISRDIHDRLGQALTALRIDQSRTEKYLRGLRDSNSLDWAVDKLHGMGELIDETIQTVRDITAELRPGILDDIGLGAAIEWEAGIFTKRTGIACDVDICVLPEVVYEPVATQVYRILQEVLTNVARHADATAVRIRVVTGETFCNFEITDNGRGLGAEAVGSPASLGILGMQERAQSVRGSISFEGRRGEGTRVTLSLPLDAVSALPV